MHRSAKSERRKGTFDSKPDKRTVRLTKSSKPVTTLSWSCNGERLFSSSEDSPGRIWSFTVKDGALGWWSEPRTSSVAAKVSPSHPQLAEWSPVDSGIVAYTTKEDHIVVLDIKRSSSPEITKLKTTSGKAPFEIAFHPNGKHLVAACVQNGSTDDLCVFDIKKPSPIKTWKRAAAVTSIGWERSGGYLLIGDSRGYLDVHEDVTFKKVYSIKAHASNIYCLCFDRNGRLFATGGSDSMVAIWDCKDFVCLRTFSQRSTAILSLSFNHKGTLVAACHEDGLVDLIDTNTCEIVDTIERAADESEHHKASQPHIITFNPKYDVLAFSSDQRDGSIFLHEPYIDN